MSSRRIYVAQQVITRHSLDHREFPTLGAARRHCLDEGWRNWGVVKIGPDSAPFANDGRRTVSQTSDTISRAYLEEVVQAINERIGAPV